MSRGGLRHLTPVCPVMTSISAPAAHVFISESSAPFFRFSQVRTKKGKRPKRERFADRPPELQDTKRLGVQRIRLEDRVARGPEAPYSIARNITQYLGRLVGEHGGEFHLRRAKDFTIRHKHRMLRFAGLTHDASKYDASLDRPQLTNLEALQREATLPASMREKRFPFPHLLSYSVYWSHDASPDPTPNAYDVGSVTSVRVTFDTADLPNLTRAEKTRVADIAGPENCSRRERTWTVVPDGGATSSGSESGGGRLSGCGDDGGGAEKTREVRTCVSLETDCFDQRNHNAALLGDQVEALLKVQTPAEARRSIVAH